MRCISVCVCVAVCTVSVLSMPGIHLEVLGQEVRLIGW